MKDNIIFREKHQINENFLPEIPDYWHDEYESVVNLILNTPMPVNTIISIIYKFIELFNNEFVSSFTVCSSGCSHCCHIDVDVTTVEVEYISDAASLSLDNLAIRSSKNGRPCVFLENDTRKCGIYSIRPFKCRTFHTIDHPKYCASNESHWVYGNAPNGFNNVFYKGFYELICQLNSDRPKKYLSNFFPNKIDEGYLEDINSKLSLMMSN
jgi:Fe-S-cluster containining protein